MKYLLYILLLLSFSGVYGQEHWETVIKANDLWRYYPATTEVPGQWKDPDFDDNSWSLAKGGFGYADGDDSTTIAVVNSVYLRRSFYVGDDTHLIKLLLDIDYDDAFVAYINGVEVARSANIEDDPPLYNSALLYDHEARMYEGGSPERYAIDRGMIETGQNVLAVQVLNISLGSSDLSSNVFLHALLDSENLVYQSTPEWFWSPLSYESSNLPILKINTLGQNIANEPRITAQLGIINNGVGERNYFNDAFSDYNGQISIEIRGQSSQMFPKKSYAFETQNDTSGNLNVSLLGMPEENDWILYAPYSDKSMLRNAFTFHMGARLSTYCSRLRYCELYVNEDYQGVYVLMEKIKRDDKRVDIASLDSIDNAGGALTGGYIFKVDKIDGDYRDGIDGFTSRPDPSYPNAKDLIYQYYYPKPDDLTSYQRDYLKDFIIEAEAALISGVFNDPDNGYNKYINTGSFVDFLLINEVSKEVDKYRYSSYFYKTKDNNGGEIYAGPIWDFNLGYGNVNYWDFGLQSNGWVFEDVQPYEWSTIFWWKRLMEDPYFKDLVIHRWQDLRSNEFSNANIIALVDSLTSVLDESKDRNYEKWPIMGTKVWPNYNWQYNEYEDEVIYFMNWLLNRIEWMDGALSSDVPEPRAELIPGGISDRGLEYRIILHNDYFEHRAFEMSNFALSTSNASLKMDTILYESASSAIVVFNSESPSAIEGSFFSMYVADPILNGFTALQTEEAQIELLGSGDTEAHYTDIYSYENTIVIRQSAPAINSTLEVYNSLGQLLEVHQPGMSFETRLETHVRPGIYIVRFRTLHGTRTEKLRIGY